MKKYFIVALSLLTIGAFGQKVDGRYTPSGGVLGALNFSKARVTGSNTSSSAFDYDFGTGWAAGVWASFPLGKVVSFEPQLLYSQLKYKAKTTSNPVLLADGSSDYISLPLLFKFHLGKVVALTAGPEINFLASNKDKRNLYSKSDLKSTDIGLSGGLELFPHGRVTLFGRYIYGLTNVRDNSGNRQEVVVGDYFNQNIQAGLKLRLFGGKFIPSDTDADGVPNSKDKCPTVAGLERYQGCPIPDTDKDGINDEVDKCVDVPGLEKYAGCPIPDTDKDGINDEEDKCIDVPGIAKYNGCPIPDTDKDGINDEEDKCIDVAGVAKYNGCPVPDKDNDGVNDDEDRCPDVPGQADNGGCPTLESTKFSASAIQFLTGSATLTKGAQKTLDAGAKILNEQYPQIKVEIGGHTDNTGKAESNKKLSEKRANAVKAYLAKKGVAADRLSAVGYGQDQPIGDNATKDGKAKNRRVEFKVSQ